MTLTKELKKILDERHGKKCKWNVNIDHYWRIFKSNDDEFMIYECTICDVSGPVKIEVLPEA